MSKRRITPEKSWLDEEVKVYKEMYDAYKLAYGKNPNVTALSIINLSIQRALNGEKWYWDTSYPGKLVWEKKL